MKGENEHGNSKYQFYHRRFLLSFSFEIADDYESKKNRETSGQQRLTALLDAPGGRDDLEEEDEEDTETTVARADDIDAELTVSEIMDLKPKKMVMNSSEKIMNRYCEGALGPVENVTAFFETSKVEKNKNKITTKVATRDTRVRHASETRE